MNSFTNRLLTFWIRFSVFAGDVRIWRIQRPYIRRKHFTFVDLVFSTPSRLLKMAYLPPCAQTTHKTQYWI